MNKIKLSNRTDEQITIPANSFIEVEGTNIADIQVTIQEVTQ